MTPVLLPQVPVDRAALIRAEEQRILDAEGPSHVGGTYYGVRNAARARFLEAERRVAAIAQHAAFLARHRCPWCGLGVTIDEPHALVTGEPLHASCYAQLGDVLAAPTEPTEAYAFAAEAF